MTSEQVKVFNQLLNDKGFKGKKQLKHLLWLNTSEPKFKVGECLIVSDPGHRVYGYPVKDFKAKITEISSWRDTEEWRYTLQMEVECGDKKTVSNAYLYEKDLVMCPRCKDNLNILGDPKSKYSDSIEM